MEGVEDCPSELDSKYWGKKTRGKKCISAKHHTTHFRNRTLSRLRKGSKEREVQAGENFSYLASFSHKLYRITVSQISPKAWLKGRDMKRL